MDEYKVLKVKFDTDIKSAHHLFYKKYKPNRNDDLDKLISSQAFESNTDLAKRTLFANGLPAYMNPQAVKSVFSIFGAIDNVQIFSKVQASPFGNARKSEKKMAKSYFSNDDSKLPGFKVAYITFCQEGSVIKALAKPVEEERVISGEKQPIAVGFKKWIDDYKSKFIDEKKMKKEIDAYMQLYDIEQTKLEEEVMEKTNQPDEDGWITVTNKSRKANLAMTERNISKLKSKQKKRSEKMSLLNFYNFQAKDTKKEYIINLRKRFEEDKKQIEEMKTNRKFKPF